MRCPKCGFISFDDIQSCEKCKKDVSGTTIGLGGTAFSAVAPRFLRPEGPQEDDNEFSEGFDNIDTESSIGETPIFGGSSFEGEREAGQPEPMEQEPLVNEFEPQEEAPEVSLEKEEFDLTAGFDDFGEDAQTPNIPIPNELMDTSDLLGSNLEEPSLNEEKKDDLDGFELPDLDLSSFEEESAPEKKPVKPDPFAASSEDELEDEIDDFDLDELSLNMDFDTEKESSTKDFELSFDELETVPKDTAPEKPKDDMSIDLDDDFGLDLSLDSLSLEKK